VNGTSVDEVLGHLREIIRDGRAQTGYNLKTWHDMER